MGLFRKAVDYFVLSTAVFSSEDAGTPEVTRTVVELCPLHGGLIVCRTGIRRITGWKLITNIQSSILLFIIGVGELSVTLALPT